MAYPDHLLSRGERVVLHKHPHWKVLVLPVLLFLLIIGAGAFGASYAYRHTGNYPYWWIGIGVVGLLLLIYFSLAPFIRWRTEHFVISTRHVFFRTGFFKRREHQIPLGRIQNLETNVTFWGRIFGYGTLTVDSAADEPLAFFNVASLPQVQSTLNQLIADDRAGGGLGDPMALPPRDLEPDAPARRPQDTRSYPTGDSPQPGQAPDFRAVPPPADGR